MTSILYTGNSLKHLSNIETGTIDIIITSPPYNCRKDYGNGWNDEITWGDYYAWMKEVLKECYRVLIKGGIIACNVPNVVRWQADHKYAATWQDYNFNYSNRRNGERVTGKGRIEPIGYKLFDMMFQIDSHIREPIIWVKGSIGNAICTTYQMGCDSDPYLRPAHEMILLGSKEQWCHRGGTGRRGPEAMPYLDECKDIWFIPPERSNEHPAIFPMEIPRRLLRLFVHAPDAVVLDPFCGIGTTGLACTERDVNFIGIEQNPKFARIAENRIAAMTKQTKLNLE
jgi:site-specific DNA-methyltransferase (adenine-specific)